MEHSVPTVSCAGNSRHHGIGQIMPKIAGTLLVVLVLEAVVYAKSNDMHLPSTTRRALSSLRIDLKHPLHADSPFHLPNLTLAERVQHMVKSSKERLNYLTRNTDSAFGMTHSEHVASLSYSYIVPLKIGTDFEDRRYSGFWAMLDIDLELTWVQCTPLDYGRQRHELLFNPLRSTSYHNFKCSEWPGLEYCQRYNYEQRFCESDQCQYDFQYRKWHLKGYLGIERFTFSNKGTNVARKSFVFGCDLYNEPRFFRGKAASMGLGRGPLSLFSQAGISSFSYCLPDIFHIGHGSGSIFIGNHDPSLTRDMLYTPLHTKRNSRPLYFIKLQKIYVGEASIDIPDELMRYYDDGHGDDRDDGNGGFIMDTLLLFTAFPTEVFKPFRDTIAATLGHANLRDPSLYITHGEDNLNLCYDISDRHHLYNFFPPVIFQFEGHEGHPISITLPTKNVFIMGKDGDGNTMACLAFLEHIGPAKQGYLGSYQQMNFEVVFDMEKNQIGFEPRNCITNPNDKNIDLH